MPRQWGFIADMNHDGVVTISDVWLWLKWLFFYPGDLLHYVLMSTAPGVAQFLELSPDSYGGWGSGIVSSVVWLILLPTLIVLVGATESPSSARRASTLSPGSRTIWLRKLPWWVGMAVLIPLYAVITYCVAR